MLAAAALLLGGGAAILRTPYPSQPALLDIASLASDIVAERDHVTPIQLAEWIRDRKPSLRVLDVRTAADYRQYHIPTAELVSLPALAAHALSPDETVVLYSAGGAHAAQGWVLLRARRHQRVFFLSGGLDEWFAEVMTPTLPANATDAEKAEFERALRVCQYFGGEPTISSERRTERNRREVPRWRRGC
jgi:rhodanese-related sulfurtransferase